MERVNSVRRLSSRLKSLLRVLCCRNSTSNDVDGDELFGFHVPKVCALIKAATLAAIAEDPENQCLKELEEQKRAAAPPSPTADPHAEAAMVLEPLERKSWSTRKDRPYKKPKFEQPTSPRDCSDRSIGLAGLTTRTWRAA